MCAAVCDGGGGVKRACVGPIARLRRRGDVVGGERGRREHRAEVRVEEGHLERADEVREEELAELERRHAAHVPVQREEEAGAGR